MRPTAEDQLRLAIEAKDRVSKSWAAYITPCIFSMYRARRLSIDSVLDWIEETEAPINVFDFSELSRMPLSERIALPKPLLIPKLARKAMR